MKTLVFTLFLVFEMASVPCSRAQQVIAAGNGSDAAGGYMLHCTLGQTFYTSESNVHGQILEGIQLPFECAVLAVPGFENSWLDCRIFPNPARTTARLVLNCRLKNLHFSLFDLEGKLLLSGDVGEEGTLIPLEGLSASLYLLRINQGNQTLADFKIVRK